MLIYENKPYCFNCLKNIIRDPSELCKYINCKKCGNNITMINGKDNLAECSVCKTEYSLNINY